MKCLNCNTELPEGKSFCDSLCRMGYNNKQFKDFYDNFKRALKEYPL